MLYVPGILTGGLDTKLDIKPISLKVSDELKKNHGVDTVGSITRSISCSCMLENHFLSLGHH